MDYPIKDQWGRPIVLAPGAEKEEAYTRVTTIAKTLNGFEALTTWKQVMVAGGAHLRPDILAKIAARWPDAWPPDSKTKAEIEAAVEELKEAAAASTGSNLGDALHELIARTITGERTRKALPPLNADLDAFVATMAAAEIDFRPEYVERTVLLPAWKVAGSFDYLIEKNDQLIVADLKTGRDLSHSWQAICVQLALYSRAEWIYDWQTKESIPMPAVNQRQGLVIWLPAGKATCSLHVVDLESGWAAAEQCFWVRNWRQRKDLARAAKANGKGK